MKSQTLNKLRIMAMTAVVAIASIGTAEAGRVTGRFDPAFGALFPNLGWMGTVELQIPDSCFLGNDSDDTRTSSDTCNTTALAANQMKVLGATVSLYDNTTPAHALLQTLSYSSTALFPFNLESVRFNGTNIIGVDTNYFGPDSPDNCFLTTCGGPGFDGINAYSFALGFDLITGPSLVAIADGNVIASASELILAILGGGNFSETFPVVYLNLINTSITGGAGGSGESRIPVLTSGTYSFSGYLQVPEPGSLALILTALAGLAIATRRRQTR